MSYDDYSEDQLRIILGEAGIHTTESQSKDELKLLASEVFTDSMMPVPHQKAQAGGAYGGLEVVGNPLHGESATPAPAPSPYGDIELTDAQGMAKKPMSPKAKFGFKNFLTSGHQDKFELIDKPNHTPAHMHDFLLVSQKIASTPVHSSATTIEAKHGTKDIYGKLDTWDSIKPTDEALQEFINNNHPRDFFKGRNKKTVEKFSLCNSSLGRHCDLHGCGERFDMCGEGSQSSFLVFGSGVSNYFKFTKWCGWICFIFTILSLPALIINSWGDGDTLSEDTQLSRLAYTTIGNLGDSVNSSFIRIPFCVPGDGNSSVTLVSDDCTLTKSTIGKMYVTLDLIGVVCFLVGYGWLRRAELKEHEIVRRHVVTVPDFTVQVKNIPQDTTESDIRNHFERVAKTLVAESRRMRALGKIGFTEPPRPHSTNERFLRKLNFVEKMRIRRQKRSQDGAAEERDQWFKQYEEVGPYFSVFSRGHDGADAVKAAVWKELHDDERSTISALRDKKKIDAAIDKKAIKYLNDAILVSLGVGNQTHRGILLKLRESCQDLVHSVSIAEDAGPLINLYQARGRAVKKRNHATAQVLFHQHRILLEQRAHIKSRFHRDRHHLEPIRGQLSSADVGRLVGIGSGNGAKLLLERESRFDSAADSTAGLSLKKLVDKIVRVSAVTSDHSEANSPTTVTIECDSYFWHDRKSREEPPEFGTFKKVIVPASLIGWVKDEKLDKARDKRVDQNKKIGLRNKMRAQLPRGENALTAFVTFNEEEAAVAFLRLYKGSKKVLGLLWQKEHLRLTTHSNKSHAHKIVVSSPPEPSTILWENLQFTGWSRRKSDLKSFAIAALVLLCALVTSVLAKFYQQKSKDEGGTQACPGDWDFVSQDMLILKGALGINATAPDGGVWTQNELHQQWVRYNSEIAHCWCTQIARREQLNDPLCREYFYGTVVVDILYASTSAVVGIVNAVLITAMRHLSRQERHHNLTERETSFYVRVFILLFLNTGVVISFANSQYFLYYTNKITGTAWMQGTRDFDTEWYQTVGATIILISLLNSVAPHALPIVKYLRALRKQRKEKDKCVTQADQNNLFFGPRFHISSRYASSMTVMFVTLMYGAGMPILYPIACFSFVLSFWIDKYLFINYYRRPPQYDAKLGRRASGTLMYGLLLHLVVSIWMYGNKAVFISEQYIASDGVTGAGIEALNNYDPLSVADKISQEHVYPLFAMFTVVLLSLLLGRFRKSLSFVLDKICVKLTCNKVRIDSTHILHRQHTACDFACEVFCVSLLSALC
jgi:hypothetical protein